MVSPAATSPALSATASFPYFVRDVQSDAVLPRALAAALQQVAPALTQRGLISVNRMTVVLIHSDDAEHVQLAGMFVAALESSTQLAVGLRVQLPGAAAAESLAALVAPVCASDDRTLVALLPEPAVLNLIDVGHSLCGLNSTRHVCLLTFVTSICVSCVCA